MRQVDRVRDDEPLQEVLYIPSPTVVKRMSLGYSGLLADIYWTRVVQYFGTKHRAKAKQYLILKPLLEMTTALGSQAASGLSVRLGFPVAEAARGGRRSAGRGRAGGKRHP